MKFTGGIFSRGDSEMTRLALQIDLERCIGCKSCEAACKLEHGLGPGERRNRVIWLGDDASAEDARPKLDFLTLTCQQCDRPACVRACPVNPKAITKDGNTGIVQVIEDRCVGCGECVVACPYGAMGFDAHGQHAVKCDLCVERRSGGIETTACQSVCPARAIKFGDVKTLADDADVNGRQRIQHDPFLLGPATMYLDRIDESARLDLTRLAEPVVVDPVSQIDATAARYPFRAPRKQRKANRVVAGGCNICFNSCTTKFHFKDEQLVKVTGNEQDPVLQGRICPKSQLSVQLYDSEHRLRQPLKRIGERGENKFEEISWQQALDEIADRLRDVAKQHGNESLGIFSGTRTGSLTNKGYIRLFSQMFGTPNVETTEPFCSAGKFLAFMSTLGAGGSGNSYTRDDLGSAQLYVYIGDNQAETRPVSFGMINDWRLRNKARMICIDPRQTVTASKADLHLPIRPGTDMALALALAWQILTDSLQDEHFCKNWVAGFNKWREFIFRKNYSPAWAAPITGLSETSIRDLAHEIAEADGCVIFGSRGINQHVNSVQTNRALMFVAAITGNWGRRGGTYFNMSTSVPLGASAPANRVTTIARPKIGATPLAWTEAMLSERPYAMKAFITCNNPMALWPDQRTTREALKALDLLVHIDLFANETSAWSDYVLPAATGIEKGEIGRATEDRRVVWIDKMIEPPGNARADGWIWIELGKRFGFDDVLKEEYKDSAVFWDEQLIGNPQMRGCTQKRLHSVPWRWVRFPVNSEHASEVDTLYLEGTTAAGAADGHRFPTASGKLEFYTDELDYKFLSQGLSALPEFYGERESLVDMPHLETVDCSVEQITLPDEKHTTEKQRASVSPRLSEFWTQPTLVSKVQIVQPADARPAQELRDQGFNMELITGRPAAPHFHSWTHYAWQAQEMWPDLYVQIHPKTAASLAIADGDLVEIETAHGSIDARAWLFSGVQPHSVFVPIGWGERQPFNPWRPVNFLTDKSQRDPISEQSNLKSLLCRIKPGTRQP